MTMLTANIEVAAPLQAVYDQWRHFEDFPEFLSHVESVEREPHDLTRWTVQVGGIEREFVAAIVDHRPNDHIAWASLDGPEHAGRVDLDSRGPARTAVHLEIQWDRQSFVDRPGAVLDVDAREAEQDLERFKRFMEARVETT